MKQQTSFERESRRRWLSVLHIMAKLRHQGSCNPTINPFTNGEDVEFAVKEGLITHVGKGVFNDGEDLYMVTSSQEGFLKIVEESCVHPGGFNKHKDTVHEELAELVRGNSRILVWLITKGFFVNNGFFIFSDADLANPLLGIELKTRTVFRSAQGNYVSHEKILCFDSNEFMEEALKQIDAGRCAVVNNCRTSHWVLALPLSKDKEAATECTLLS